MSNPLLKPLDVLGKVLDGAPDRILRAVVMLYAVIGLSVVRLLISVIRHWEVRTPFMMITIFLVIWVISGLLIHLAGRGRNWARWSLVVVLTVSIPLSVLPTLGAIAHSPVPNILGLVQVVLYVWALFLLFHPDSTAWYKAKSAATD